MSDLLTWPAVISALMAREDLTIRQSTWAMEEIVRGHATDAQIAGFAVALRAKGETVDEVVGFRDAILDAAVPLDVDPMALDIVGTGGDVVGTVNVSTMAADRRSRPPGSPSSSTATARARRSPARATCSPPSGST